MIDHSTVDKIIDTADILDVVQEYVTLKKRGTNYIGLCPFHNEKTPSFNVSPSRGIFKCFGCGKGGKSVRFIMEHEQMTYVEALRFLAKKYHIDIVEKEQTEDDKAQKSARESLLAVSSFAQKYFSRMLQEDMEGIAIGQSYLKERGFSAPISEKFQIGYCPDRKDAFTQEALKNGYKIEFLEQTGLTVKKEEWQADRFSGRIIFPIHSISGQVIGFGGRTLKSDKKIAKYLNSPESDIYHKSNVLYGLYFAKKSIVNLDKCYLVEGYIDVTSFHQAGIENVVASSGTALTSQQIRLIKRFTNNITVLFDGDAAGLKAAIRGIDLILEEGMNVKVALFPDGEDPDSFSRSVGSSGVMEFLKKEEKDFISFKTKLLLEEAKDDPTKRAGLIRDIVSSIAVIPDKPLRSEYISLCSKLMKVEEEMLHFEVNARLRKKTTPKTEENIPDEPRQQAPQQVISPGEFYEEEREIIRVLLHYAEKELYPGNEDKEKITVAGYVTKQLLKDDLLLKHPVYSRIFNEYLKALSEDRELESKYFINHNDAAICKVAADLLTENNRLSKLWTRYDSKVETEDMILKKIVPKAINEFKYKYTKLLIKEITNKMMAAQEENNTELLNDLMQQIILLDKVKNQLSNDLGERTIM